MRRTTPVIWGALAFSLVALAAGASQFHVGLGGNVDLGTGALDLGCADLTVTGTLSSGTNGFTQVRDLVVDPAGLLNGESAVLEVAGDWDNAGSFDAGTSTVRLVDGCGLASAVVAGDTVFANLEMTTTGGFLYSFVSGTTQSVTGVLSLLGAEAKLLTLRSTLSGMEASLDLTGTHSADFVDVEDNHAIGNPISVGLNSVLGSNTPGWGLPAALPLLSPLGLGALTLLLLGPARRMLATSALRTRGR